MAAHNVFIINRVYFSKIYILNEWYILDRLIENMFALVIIITVMTTCNFLDGIIHLHLFKKNEWVKSYIRVIFLQDLDFSLKIL